jgi:hypothetical protein
MRINDFQDVLDRAGTRPAETAAREQKKNYAELLSNCIAVLVANKLRDKHAFRGEILPRPDGTGRESKSVSGRHKKAKKTDVRFSTLETGLELLVSIKTISFRDWNARSKKLGRYTKNMVRNDHELRAEAMDHHARHPYAVLAALIFLPYAACDDAVTGISSFAHAVVTFRPRTGRELPSDPPELFERIFIALYEHQGEKRGQVEFFDPTQAPPRRGKPKNGLVSLDVAVNMIFKDYGIRNKRYIEWADEEESPTLLSTQADASSEEDDEEAEGDED